MILKRDDLDGHFGFQVTPMIDAATGLHGKKFGEQMDGLLRGMETRPKE
jgi:hypothetical protein